jgi:hypothetical protein
MKFNPGLRLIGVCVALAATSLAAQPARTSSKAEDSASTNETAALSRAEALKIVSEARQYVAHPTPPPPPGKITPPQVKTPDFKMDEPPPAARTETKPEAPAAGYVWVPGHYMPVKGQWRWVRGEWAVPATPISVWIPARYDEDDKKWSPGYWQPDVATTAHPQPATKADTPPASSSSY